MDNFKPFIFEGINKYSDFREALNKVKQLEEFIEFHSKNYFSGFYDGQWSLLPELV